MQKMLILNHKIILKPDAVYIQACPYMSENRIKISLDCSFNFSPDFFYVLV